MREEIIPEVKGLVERIAEKPRVGDYVLQAKLGEGAFAVAFTATRDAFGRLPVVLKLPRVRSAIPDIESRQLVLSALGKSPYSVNLVDQGTWEGLPYVVEEKGDRSFADVLAANNSKGKLPSLREIQEVGGQLLAALDNFNRLEETDPEAARVLRVKSLTHNDLKPNNIIEMKDSTGKTVRKLTDFGVRFNGNNVGAQTSCVNSISIESMHSINGHGEPLSDIYAAPEVLRGLIRQKITGEPLVTSVPADLYSGGSILFHYATGKCPQWGMSDPSEFRSDLPDGMVEFFKTILNREPGKRFQSAREALSALENKAVDTEPDFTMFGLMRVGESTYRLFRQPVKNGSRMKIKPEDNFEFEGHKINHPSLAFSGSLNRFVVCSWTGDYFKGFRVTVLDTDLRPVAEKELFGVEDQLKLPNFYFPTLIENSSKGWVGLRQKTEYYTDDMGRHVTRLEAFELPSFNPISVRDCDPATQGNEWVQIYDFDPAKAGIQLDFKEPNYRVNVQNGAAIVRKTDQRGNIVTGSDKKLTFEGHLISLVGRY